MIGPRITSSDINSLQIELGCLLIKVFINKRGEKPISNTRLTLVLRTMSLDDMKRELRERFNKLERSKVIWEEPIQIQARVLDMQDVTACLSLFKNFLVENLSKITFTSEMRGYRPGYHWYNPNTKEIVIGYPFKEDVIADFEGTKTAQLSNLAHEFGHHIDFQISGLRDKCNEIARKKNASCSREGFASLISWMVSGVKVYEYYKYSNLSILEEITSTIREATFST